LAPVHAAGRKERRDRQRRAGDIAAVAKVDEIEFDCVLHDSHDEDHIHMRPLEFPTPMQGRADTEKARR
jgi:elongation factor G